MPFSTKLEQEYKELVQDNIKSVTFEDQKDILHFCDSVDALIDSDSADEIKPDKFKEDLESLHEIIDGFDIYATDKIIDLRTDTQVGRSSISAWVRIPAFASEQKEISRSQKLMEAKAEFKNIIINEIQLRVNELRTMSVQQQNQYIMDQRKTRENTKKSHKIIADHTAHTEIDYAELNRALILSLSVYFPRPQTPKVSEDMPRMRMMR